MLENVIGPRAWPASPTISEVTFHSEQNRKHFLSTESYFDRLLNSLTEAVVCRYGTSLLLYVKLGQETWLTHLCLWVILLNPQTLKHLVFIMYHKNRTSLFKIILLACEQCDRFTSEWRLSLNINSWRHLYLHTSFIQGCHFGPSGSGCMHFHVVTVKHASKWK